MNLHITKNNLVVKARLYGFMKDLKQRWIMLPEPAAFATAGPAGPHPYLSLSSL